MDLKQLGQKVKRLRKAGRFTQKTLASRSGVAYATIQDIEDGRGNPTIGTLEALASTLGSPIGALFNINIDGQEATEEVRHPFARQWLQESARVLEALSRCPTKRRLVVLYLLLKDESYLHQLEQMHEDPHLVQALKLIT